MVSLPADRGLPRWAGGPGIGVGRWKDPRGPPALGGCGLLCLQMGSEEGLPVRSFGDPRSAGQFYTEPGKANGRRPPRRQASHPRRKALAVSEKEGGGIYSETWRLGSQIVRVLEIEFQSVSAGIIHICLMPPG